MSRKLIYLSGSALAIGLATWLGACTQSGDHEASVIKKQYKNWSIEYLNNSPTASQALGMNASGSIIGVKESSSLRNGYFYFDKDGFKDMPIPKGFTNVVANALSDTNLVIGRTMKAVGSGGSLRAIAWLPGQGDIKLLPLPDGYEIADACDVAADGNRITGYATGATGLVPVVWQWQAKTSEWQVERLPTEHENNPYLMSAQLIISPDGKIIVGCCTESITEDGIDSALYEWRQSDGKWIRRLVTAEQMYVKAMNNKGEIAGSLPGNYGRLPCLVTLEGKLTRLELLDDDVAGEARDINEDSIIVGWSDNPPSPDGGPTPCTWTLEGKPTQVKLNELGLGMLYAINAEGQMAGAADVITKPTTDPKDEEQSVLLGVRVSKSK